MGSPPFDSIRAPFLPLAELPARRALRQLVATRAALETLERALVLEARRDGASWTEIAGDLGITRQSLRARHRTARPEDG